MAVRRLAPLPVLVLVLAASVTSAYLGFSKDPMVAVAILSYTAAAAAPAGAAVAALILAEIGVVITWHAPVAGASPLARVTATALVQLAAWTTGFAVRTQRRYAAGLRQQAERRVQAEADRLRRTLAEERLRIARELHDVVAHSMAVIAVQAGVGGYVAQSRPRDAGMTLRAIEETSRSALQELRRMLSLLRDDSGAAGRDGPDLLPAPAARCNTTGPAGAPESPRTGRWNSP